MEEPTVIEGGAQPVENYPPLPDGELREIESGLLIPSDKAIRCMVVEIRKYRGDPNPYSE